VSESWIYAGFKIKPGNLGFEPIRAHLETCAA
jgi:hypothetical protein